MWVAGIAGLSTAWGFEGAAELTQAQARRQVCSDSLFFTDVAESGQWGGDIARLSSFFFLVLGLLFSFFVSVFGMSFGMCWN